MTSEAYVWIWLPDAKSPIVCGRIRADGPHYEFVYGQSYLTRPSAISLDPRQLPLKAESFRPDVGELHGVLRDAAPDAWGRRILDYHSEGSVLTELEYLLNAGYDRIGALDVCNRADDYALLNAGYATLSDLFQAAEKVEEGITLPKELDNALLHGSSVGGARPKALLDDDDTKWIAKFSSTTDHYPIVRFEHAAMWLAGQCGIKTPQIRLAETMGKDVFLIQRFDRIFIKGSWRRKLMVSALTALLLHETEAQLASYVDIAEFIRRNGNNFISDMQDLFKRMVFNILIGNTDDHARNHAFFWDGQFYQLTPAYDICPMPRAGHTANQSMIIGKHGRLGTIKNALSEANQFGLTEVEADHICKNLAENIRSSWPEATALSKLTKKQSAMLRANTVLSPGCFYG